MASFKWGHCAARFFGLLLLILGSAVGRAQFLYETNNGAITITGNRFSSSEPGTALIIPSAINGWPVTRIGPLAFRGIKYAVRVTIPKSVINIEPGAFALSDLEAITVDPLSPSYTNVDGVLFNKNVSTLIQYPLGKVGAYAIPNSVTNLETSGYYCTGGSMVCDARFYGPFVGCIGLTSVTIPNSVTRIPEYAFAYCARLTKVTIAHGVTSIGAGAFSECASLTDVTIPGSVTNIQGGLSFYFALGGGGAFARCSSLKSIVIPNGVTQIGGNAFAQCTGLTDVTLPDSITQIEGGTFFGCTSLTTLTIPGSVQSIGSESSDDGEDEAGAFQDCTRLSGIYFRGNSPGKGIDLFSGTQKVVAFHLPGTTGWGATFGGRPTALWMPRAESRDDSLGVHANQFGFNITWASGQVVMVEASTELVNPVWSPLQTITLTGDSVRFTDPEGSKEPTRFYRVRPQ